MSLALTFFPTAALLAAYWPQGLGAVIMLVAFVGIVAGVRGLGGADE